MCAEESARGCPRRPAACSSASRPVAAFPSPHAACASRSSRCAACPGTAECPSRPLAAAGGARHGAVGAASQGRGVPPAAGRLLQAAAHVRHRPRPGGGSSGDGFRRPQAASTARRGCARRRSRRSRQVGRCEPGVGSCSAGGRQWSAASLQASQTFTFPTLLLAPPLLRSRCRLERTS